MKPTLYRDASKVDAIEYEIIIDLGMLNTKIGTSNEQIPFKIVPTPPNIFLNDKFFKEENLKIYNNYTNELFLKITEFFYDIFFKELLYSPKGFEVVIGINLFIPNHYLLCIERSLIEKFEAKAVYFVPTQFSPIYMSNHESGIILDFGFSNITIVPFYKGFPLKNFIKTTRKSGIYFFKRLYKSACKINPKFEDIVFEDQLDLLNKLSVEYMSFNTCKEVSIIENNQTEAEIKKMRHKILKMIHEKANVYINYLENYRVCETLFNDSNNIVIDILDALVEIPSSLRDFLVNNIIIVGGFCLYNKFMKRLKDELNNYVRTNQYYKNQFSDYFTTNFCFTTHEYPTNLLNWAGCKLISIRV